MNGEFEETEAGQLLQATQRLRVQWTSVNSSLIGYTGALFIGIWTFALKASLDAKAEKAAVDDAAVYLLWAAASASIMLGLWRIFARYLDKAIVQLYPTLIYCEQTMCVPMEYGTCAYLRDHVSVANSSEAEFLELLKALVRMKRIGTRGHRASKTKPRLQSLLSNSVSVFTGSVK